MVWGRLLCLPLRPALIKYAQNKQSQSHVGGDAEMKTGDKYLGTDQI